MRLPFLSLATAAFLATAVPAQAASFTLDKSHTAITFTVDHLGFSLTHGRFSEFDAEVDFDPENPGDSSVVFTIDAPSVDTGWAKRDEHVRGADFLNVAENKDIVFKSTSVEVTGENTAKMTGDLTINGVTNSETFDVTMRKLAPSPFGKKLMTAGFVAEGVIDRTDYDVSYGAGAIGNEIPVRVDLELVATE
jgi:polyisoprenoid-binding protein YceI